MNNSIEALGLGYRKESPGEQSRIAVVGAAVTELTNVADKQIATAEAVA